MFKIKSICFLVSVFSAFSNPVLSLGQDSSSDEEDEVSNSSQGKREKKKKSSKKGPSRIPSTLPNVPPLSVPLPHAPIFEINGGGQSVDNNIITPSYVVPAAAQSNSALLQAQEFLSDEGWNSSHGKNEKQKKNAKVRASLQGADTAVLIDEELRTIFPELYSKLFPESLDVPQPISAEILLKRAEQSLIRHILNDKYGRHPKLNNLKITFSDETKLLAKLLASGALKNLCSLEFPSESKMPVSQKEYLEICGYKMNAETSQSGLLTEITNENTAEAFFNEEFFKIFIDMGYLTNLAELNLNLNHNSENREKADKSDIDNDEQVKK